MKTKLITHHSKDLIVFFSGWGCDDKAFQDITSSKDILVLWDYTDLDFKFDFTPYQSITLIAYSAGVMVASLVQDKLPKLTHKIALAGYYKTFDSYYGIRAEALKAMQSVTLDNYMEFRQQYLVANQQQLEHFNRYASQRTIESCAMEIEALQKYNQQKFKELDFDKVILAEKDQIFNTEHLSEYYQGKSEILPDSGHSLFWYYRNLDEI